MVPEDFEAVFVRIGRLACEAHYGVGRKKVTAWLEEHGKERLLSLRSQSLTYHRGETVHRPTRPCPADFGRVYRELGSKGCERHYGVGWMTIKRWRGEQGLTRDEARAILRQAFPAPGRVGITLARRAAQHLRIVRNGGFIVTAAPNNMWRVGTKVITASELLQLAQRKGFEPTA